MARDPIAKGIRILSKKGKYEARVDYQGPSSDAKKHSMYVGEFDTPEKAIIARSNFILNLF